MRKWLLLGLLGSALNIFDAFATLFMINNGLGYEANPLMAYLIDRSQLSFLIVKSLIAPTFIWLGTQCLNSQTAKFLLSLTILIYFAVFVSHLIGLYSYANGL